MFDQQHRHATFAVPPPANSPFIAMVTIDHLGSRINYRYSRDAIRYDGITMKIPRLFH